MGMSRILAEPRVSFLGDAPAPTRDHLAASVGLGEFLRSVRALSLDERRAIVDQALLVLSQNYVHLSFKAAMHAVNPVQRLRILRRQLERQTPTTMPPEWMFHAEVSEIFHSLRDLHTNYLLPEPFASKIAYLPFMVEEYFAGAAARYAVTWLVPGYHAPEFGPGTEITHWNGVPIDRAVEINGARFAGSNRAARHARGLQTLTLRPLLVSLPPDEEWATVSYRGHDGSFRELRENWLVADNLPEPIDRDTPSVAAMSQGLDIYGEATGRARKLLFAPSVVAKEDAVEDALPDGSAVRPDEIETTMPGVFRARTVRTPSGEFGHIRIFTFYVEAPDQFVDEFVRLIGQLPRNGLIVDVRGNSGGHMFASEFTLQTLTPRRIVPEPLQFAATPLNLQICRKPTEEISEEFSLRPWVRSLEQATEIGAAFSSAFPITPEDGANAWGQCYMGPVVLITDALCYSATDVFAAGFQDHGIGPVIGVHHNTGAGGANVWTQELLRQLMETPPADTTSPYRPLPKQAGIRVAMRRSLRVGLLAGTPLEDLGVVPDVRHRMTRDDLLHDNADLLARAAAMLAQMPVRALDVRAAIQGADLVLDVSAENISHLDVYLDGRPRASVQVADGAAHATILRVGGAQVARIEGFAGDQLVAARTVYVQDSAAADAVGDRVGDAGG